jgi:hypothetical protein
MANDSPTRFSKYKDRNRAEQKRWEEPPAPIRNLLSINSFMNQHFGPDSFVWHEIESHIVHVDVNVICPSTFRPHWTLLTFGMSDLAMQNPRGKIKSYAEVSLCLPAEWPISKIDTKWATPDRFWPVTVLKKPARYPHLHSTDLSWGHTVGSITEPVSLDPKGRFIGVMLIKPSTFPEGAEQFKNERGETIRVLGVIPLLTDELVFAKENGPPALEQKLFNAGVSEILDPDRKSVVSA